MCKPASGILVKGHKAFWSKYTDSHEKIIAEYKLNADGVGGTNIVPFEITPPDGDMSKPLADWQYRIDDAMNGILPDWYNAEDAEKASRVMLKDWAAQKIKTGVAGRLEDGEYFLINSKAELRGNSKAVLRGNSTAELWGNSKNLRCF